MGDLFARRLRTPSVGDADISPTTGEISQTTFASLTSIKRLTEENADLPPCGGDVTQ